MDLPQACFHMGARTRTIERIFSPLQYILRSHLFDRVSTGSSTGNRRASKGTKVPAPSKQSVCLVPWRIITCCSHQPCKRCQNNHPATNPLLFSVLNNGWRKPMNPRANGLYSRLGARVRLTHRPLASSSSTHTLKVHFVCVCESTRTLTDIPAKNSFNLHDGTSNMFIE